MISVLDESDLGTCCLCYVFLFLFFFFKIDLLIGGYLENEEDSGPSNSLEGFEILLCLILETLPEN